jgi:molybdopterin converting factor small subunit
LAVKLFAGLREQAGWHEREISLLAGPSAPTPRRLWQMLQIGQPWQAPGDRELAASALPAGPLPEYVRVAVNQSFADGDHLLVDGDEVAFLPAISGG